MAKIAILTQPLGENIGGILQAYALYKYIEQLGHTPHLLRVARDTSLAKGVLRKVLQRNPLSFLWDYKALATRYTNSKNLTSFLQKSFFNVTVPVITECEFRKIASQFDTIIVGSDQVWRHRYQGKRLLFYFLKGVPANVRKVSYAASFGVDEWEGESAKEIEEIKHLLQAFDYVSVRETSGLAILSNTFEYKKGSVCVDPTLLHDTSFYNTMIEEYGVGNDIKEQCSTPYLFAYILDLTLKRRTEVEQYATQRGLHPIFASIPTHMKSLSPSEWLYMIKNAEIVVTDSFHGSVFSLIFNTPLVTIKNKARGATRFASLFNLFGISYSDSSTIVASKQELESPIKYSQQSSRQYLIKAMNGF